MNKFSSSKKAFDENEDEINIREVIFKYLQYWKWFIASVVLFLTLGTLVYLCLDRKYQVESAVLIKDDEKGGAKSALSALGGLADLGGLGGPSGNIDNEIAIISSPNLMKQVVMELEIHTTYFEKGFFRDTEVYTECPYYVRLEDTKVDDLVGSLELTLKSNSDKIDIKGEYFVADDEFKIKGSIDKLPGFIELPNNLGRLYVAHRPNTDIEKRSETYKIYVQNARKKSYDLIELLSVNLSSKKSSVLSFSLTTLNIQKGVDFLDKMVEKYNSNTIKDNNEIAINTSVFVDKRLKEINDELKEIENEIVGFKKEQSITNLGVEAQLFLEKNTVLEQKLADIETQIQTIQLVENFIKKPENKFKLVPNIGIMDEGLAEIMVNYNSSLLNHEKLAKSASEDNPSLQRSQASLTSTRESIVAAIGNIKRVLDISKKDALRQTSAANTRISTIPIQERDLIDIMRQQQLKQTLFIYLMQVKEDTSLSMASFSDKAKVITDPIIPEKAASPKKKVIFAGFFLLGLIAPIGVIFVKEMMRVNISDRQELERLSTASILGEIMKKDSTEGVLVVKENKTTPIVELFRTLRNNIQFILDSPDKKVILTTSTIPGEGKTFISINLAASFTLLNKKVLLLGMDIRNPRLAVDLNFKKGAGLTTYLSGSEPNWQSLLITLKDYPTLDILQAGPVPPNPNELLMKPELGKMIEEARQIYDIIIIDSAPIGVVSDTFSLNSVADTTIYVTREDVTPKRAIEFVNEVYEGNRLPNMYLVLNGADLSKNKSRYGYTYGYGEVNKL